MKSINLFSVSEARAQFWKILKLVSAGEDVVIVNRRKKQKFHVNWYRTKLIYKPGKLLGKKFFAVVPVLVRA